MSEVEISAKVDVDWEQFNEDAKAARPLIRQFLRKATGDVRIVDAVSFPAEITLSQDDGNPQFKLTPRINVGVLKSKLLAALVEQESAEMDVEQ